MTIVEFAIKPHQRLNYVGLFELEKDREYSMSGQRARVVLSASGLPNELLATIWNLSDRDGDGELSEEEFLIAYHLVVLATKGVPVPTECPSELVSSAASAAPVMLWRWPLPILPSPSFLCLRRYFAPLVAAPEVGQYWRYLLLFNILALILFFAEWFVFCPAWLGISNLLGLGHLGMFVAVEWPREARLVKFYLVYIAVVAVLHICATIYSVVATSEGSSCASHSIAAIVVLELIMVLPVLLVNFMFGWMLHSNLVQSMAFVGFRAKSPLEDGSEANNTYGSVGVAASA